MLDRRPSRPQLHKRIRLAGQAYAQAGTIAVQGRRPIFAQPGVAAAAVDVLRRRAEATGVRVYGYCVMPDHVHLVLGPSEACDIVTFVGQYKNLAQRAAWGQGITGRFWQKSFWDHFLRADEAVADVVAYVLNNPVRRGLVQRWQDYPFAGSLVLDL